MLPRRLLEVFLFFFVLLPSTAVQARLVDDLRDCLSSGGPQQCLNELRNWWLDSRIFAIFFSQRQYRVVARDGVPEDAYPLQACEGHCENHAECDYGLNCDLSGGTAPGCLGDPPPGNNNFCYKENDKQQLVLLGENGSPSSSYPLPPCRGSCRTDADCATGTQCFVRTGTEEVPGCKGEGIAGVSYCYGKKATYVPGKATVFENGLALSEGLTSRVIAYAGEPVRYDTGGQSSEPFHYFPDGAAVFVDKATGRYRYVSNSESGDGGVGAIAFDADGRVIGYERLLSGTQVNCGGGKTPWPGDQQTWLSCEERNGGQIWEVDPTGKRPARKTLLGASLGGMFESVAYDNRNPRKPTFYVTNDAYGGPLLKFTPNLKAVEQAIATGDYSQVLTTPVGDNEEQEEVDGTGTRGRDLNTNSSFVDRLEDILAAASAAAEQERASSRSLNTTSSEPSELPSSEPSNKPTLSPSNAPSPTPIVQPTAAPVSPPVQQEPQYQYLKLNWEAGTFLWTTSIAEGEESASRYHSWSEGIDIRNGLLYMTCKVDRTLFILDLDAKTFEVSSTMSGAFDSEPDQVARLLDGDGDILYFCEDGGEDCGVHGRDSNGKFYSILQANTPEMFGETTGLAFGPGNLRMYVSFQQVGQILEIRRKDGLPFGGQRLDIKYHGDSTNANPFEYELN